MKKLNEFILSIRKKRSLSRKGIENLSGFKERTVASYERGERKPSEEYLLFLSLYFNIKLNCFQGSNEFLEEPMGEHLLAIERYKFIYQCKDQDILDLIKLDNNDKYYDLLASNIIFKKSIELIILISSSLKIKPSSFGFKLVSDDRIMYRGKILDTVFIEADLSILIQNEENPDFIRIDDNYYLSVLKKRNSPNEVFIPEKLNSKDERYYEVFELLPFASSDFIDKLLQQLKKFKKNQDDFFN